MSMKAILTMGACVGAVLMAQAGEPEKPASFKNTLSAGLTAADGNSETMQANASLVSEGEKQGLGSVRAGIEANYGETTRDDVKETTVNNAKAFANVKKTFSPLTFGSVDASVMQDEIADVDYRATLGPGLGTYAFKRDVCSLSFEAGPAYVWEKVGGASDDYLALRFAERLTLAPGATAKFWQSAEYLPKASDFGDYLLNGEIGAEAAMNARLNLRLVFQDKYDSTPAPGYEENDLAVIAGVSVSL
jgi:putative salt-induced outer membrane protein YdiY